MQDEARVGPKEKIIGQARMIVPAFSGMLSCGRINVEWMLRLAKFHTRHSQSENPSICM